MRQNLLAVCAVFMLGCAGEKTVDPGPSEEGKMSDAESYYREGTSLLETDPEKAIELLSKSLELEPNSPRALWDRAMAYRSVDRHSEAVRDMKRLEEVDPAIGKELRREFSLASAPYLDMGNSEFEAENYEKALEYYQAAITYDPEYANAWVGKGMVLQYTKKPDEALECYNHALSLEPESIVAYYNRADLHHEQQRLESALTDYSKVIELSPEDAEAYAGRSRVYRDLNRPDESLADIKKAYLLRDGALPEGFDN